MIVSNWTMRKFHIASLLVLVCARVVPCMPVTSPPRPPRSPSAGSSEGAGDGEPANSTRPEPEVEREGDEGRDSTGEDQDDYFQGDIRLMPFDDPYNLYRTVFKRMAFDREGSGMADVDLSSITSRLWPSGLIPFRFDQDISMEYRHYFSAAMHEWTRGTCLTFEQIGDYNISADQNYILFTNKHGCSSYVGMIGGAQEVSINSGCVSKGSQGKGHAMHELGHAIGLWHEHSRWDRDNYIRIVRENVRDNAYYNFGTIAQEKWPSFEDPGYDLLSIMHYGAQSFSKNDNSTIEVIVRIPDCAITNMGQRRTLSRRDKIKTSRIYQCENETNAQDKCSQEPLQTDPPPTPSPPPPPAGKLMSNDALRLKTNASRLEYLFCTERRCKKDECTFNQLTGEHFCEQGFDFTVHHHTPRNNQKIKNGDVVNLQSLHKQSRWLECNGQNICSISQCPGNVGSQNISNISECEDHQFVVISSRNVVRDGKDFQLKHPSNETYLFCTTKWCDLLPLCAEGEVESGSSNRDDVTCHSPTTFYVQKL